MGPFGGWGVSRFPCKNGWLGCSAALPAAVNGQACVREQSTVSRQTCGSVFSSVCESARSRQRQNRGKHAFQQVGLKPSLRPRRKFEKYRPPPNLSHEWRSMAGCPRVLGLFVAVTLCIAFVTSEDADCAVGKPATPVPAQAARPLPPPDRRAWGVLVVKARLWLRVWVPARVA